MGYEEEADDFLEDESEAADAGSTRGEAAAKRSLVHRSIREIDLQEPVTVGPEASADEAVRLMGEKRIGCVLVVESGRLVGILTERDVLMKLAVPGRRPEEFRVHDLMTPEPETLHPEQRIAVALNLMSVGGYRHVPLVDDDGRPIGVVSVKDIVNFFVDHFPKEVLTLPPSRRGFTTPEGG